MDLTAQRRANFCAWMEANDLNANLVAKRLGVTPSTIYSYESGKAVSMKGEQEAKLAAAYGTTVEAIFGAAEPPEGSVEANHIAAWRAAAGLTAESVAAELGVALGVYLQLEAGVIDLSAKWMRRLAPIFGTQEGLLLQEPSAASQELSVVVGQVAEGDRRTAAALLRTLADQRKAG